MYIAAAIDMDAVTVGIVDEGINGQSAHIHAVTVADEIPPTGARLEQLYVLDKNITTSDKKDHPRRKIVHTALVVPHSVMNAAVAVFGTNGISSLTVDSSSARNGDVIAIFGIDKTFCTVARCKFGIPVFAFKFGI